MNKFISHFKTLTLKAKIYIITQSDDDKKFNRGALLNIGAQLAKEDRCDTIILHDVDILPGSLLIPYYKVYPIHPVHIAWGISKYNSNKFLGGILSVSIVDFEKANGHPNDFWGWGGEDDALRNRLIRIGKKFIRPTISDIAEEQTHPHAPDNPDLVNETKRKQVLEDSFSWKKNGLNTLNYKIVSKESLGRNIKKIDVEII